MLKTAFSFLVATFLTSASTSWGADRFITLASTTSTEQSGLFSYLLPIFTQETGIEVRVVAVGTGQALAIAERGDADALLVHDHVGEEKFVTQGSGIDRRDIMYNDFIIAGPKSDPAKVTGSSDAIAALKRIRETAATFCSRGDDSGTHRLELRLWAESGSTSKPQGSWYRELGAGMGGTLNTAVGLDAYLLVDRASWASFKNKRDLTLLVEGDPKLFNPYSSILVNPAKHPSVKTDLARRWHEWISGKNGQTAIANFRIDGQQLFFPSSKSLKS